MFSIPVTTVGFFCSPYSSKERTSPGRLHHETQRAHCHRSPILSRHFCHPCGHRQPDAAADFGSTLVQEGAFGAVWPDALGTPTFSFNDSITTNAAFADSLGGAAAFFIPGGMLMGANTRIGTFT